MTEFFYNRLRNYFLKVGEVLRGKADAASIFPNPTDIGESRERVYAEFLKKHLPSGCNVLFGGFLFNLEGHESKQLDLIITSDASIQFNSSIEEGGKSFSCVEGTLAVVSVKSSLNSNELIDALENIASIPDKEPLGSKKPPNLKISSYKDWPYKIIYASKGIKMSKLAQCINNFRIRYPALPLSKLPDLIQVGGQGCIIKIGDSGGKTRAGGNILPNTFYENSDPSDVYALKYAILRIQENALCAKHILFNYSKMLDYLPF